VRKKKNKSGSTSVQIINKSAGYKVIRSVGLSKDLDEIKHLVNEARLMSDNYNYRPC